MNGINLTNDPCFDLTKPSGAWLGLPMVRAFNIVDAYIRMRTTGINLVAIEKVNHVVVAFEDSVPKADRPTLVRELERGLKRDVEPSLQVYLQHCQDDSRLRIKVGVGFNKKGERG